MCYLLTLRVSVVGWTDKTCTIYIIMILVHFTQICFALSRQQLLPASQLIDAFDCNLLIHVCLFVYVKLFNNYSDVELYDFDSTQNSKNLVFLCRKLCWIPKQSHICTLNIRETEKLTNRTGKIITFENKVG